MDTFSVLNINESSCASQFSSTLFRYLKSFGKDRDDVETCDFYFFVSCSVPPPPLRLQYSLFYVIFITSIYLLKNVKESSVASRNVHEFKVIP